MRRLRALTVAALAGLLALAVVVPASAASPTTRVRAFHDSPDTPKVEIILNGAGTGITASFGDITRYLDLPVGAQVTVKVLEGPAAGAMLPPVTVPASSRPLTVAAIGTLAALVDGDSSNDATAVRLKAYIDRVGIWGGWSLLRVNHTSPDAPAVDVQVRLGSSWLTVIRNLEFGESSAYLPLPQRNPFTGKLINWTFRVRISGTSTIVKTVTTPLPSQAQTVWAIGFAAKLGSADADAFRLFITKDGAN